MATGTGSSENQPMMGDFFIEIEYNELERDKMVGKGSYGKVYKATWRGRSVAVKDIETNKVKQISAFQNELRQLSRVSHKNIVTFLGACTETSNSCLVMEYAENGSLHNLLHEPPKVAYTPSHAMNWAKQCAEGVEYLHSMKPKPLVHRDLKPLNLLLFDQGRTLKICDFGTVRDKATLMTKSRGSAAWMAPEVFEDGKLYSEKCDVYSFGIILWEIIFRELPFRKKEFQQILWAVFKGDRPPIKNGCPRSIKDLITKCWDPSPDNRPAMKDVVEQMRNECGSVPNADEPLDYTQFAEDGDESEEDDLDRSGVVEPSIKEFPSIDSSKSKLSSNSKNGQRGIDKSGIESYAELSQLGFRINGHMTIFNQEFNNKMNHRFGSTNDMKNLTLTFRRLGIEPSIKPNLKHKEIVNEVSALSTTDFSSCKLFVCVYMSHGDKNGYVSAADKEFNFRDTIMDPIMGIKSLSGIPKIFIMVASRGEINYEESCNGRITSAANGIDYSNCILSYSTCEGHVSKRTRNGTYFIQSLCDIINNDNGDTSIHSIFAKVNGKLTEMYKQIPVFQTSAGDISFRDLSSTQNLNQLGFRINGHMTIFNQEFKNSVTDRTGSINDVEYLTLTFRRLGIEPSLKLNLKHKEIVSEICALSTTDFSSCKLFVCVYMSNGDKNGYVSAADKSFNFRDTIMDPIMGVKSLSGIPKIFITVANRGDINYEESCNGRITSAANGIDYSNYIVSYSTCEGHVSKRMRDGTYFIQSLCDIINNDNGDTSIHSIFAKVNGKLTEMCKQVPMYETSASDISFRDLSSTQK